MLDFDELCRSTEQIDPQTRDGLIRESCEKALQGMTAVLGDAGAADDFFMGLVLGAVISDGKIVKSEFDLIKPLIEKATGRTVTAEQATEYMKSSGEERKDLGEATATLAAAFGSISRELQKDIVLLCLLICSVDGEISQREKEWLGKLLA